MKLSGSAVLTPEGFRPGTVTVENGIIQAVETDRAPENSESYDAGNGYILPGFLDIHIHGYAGADMSDGSVEGIGRMAKALAREGVTGFLGTTMALPESSLMQVADSYRQYREAPESDGAQLFGVHLEGPFFSQAKRGAQAPEAVIDPDEGLFTRLWEAFDGDVKLMAMAPELPGAMELIRLASQKCRVSLGHTQADYDTACQALSSGADHITHLYNAMPPFVHRAPGVIGAAAEKARFCELIGDGQHLHPAVVRQTFRWFGGEKICLISDCMRAGGLPDGAYNLGGQAVTVKNGRATLHDGTLAGSVTSLGECVRRVIRMGVPKEEAIWSATLRPAQSVGLDNLTGSLTPGKRADVLITDENFIPRLVLVGGRVVYRAG